MSRRAIGLGEGARVEPARLERLAPPAPFALEHLVRLVLVEVGARGGDAVDDQRHRQDGQEHVEHQSGDQHGRQQQDVERLGERVGEQGPVELGARVGSPLSHQKKLEMLR